MQTRQELVSTERAAALIEAGHFLCIAGDEAALRQLPQGNWIGGTIPYFMAENGGTVSRDAVFISEISGYAAAPTLRLYDPAGLPQICRNAPENGYSILIMPAFSSSHASFARNAPNYEEMYMKPLIGWIAGVHLDDLKTVTPKVVLGTTGEFAEDKTVVMDVPLAAEKFAQIDIVNLFRQGRGATITFPETGFSANDCLIDGQTANFADYLSQTGHDPRLPLVADYSGAMINVSIKAIDRDAHQVEFYAPVFPGIAYRLAEPVADYISTFQGALPELDSEVTFSCNCILNYLYSDLEGKSTGQMIGPITYGEIGYQLLNQTLVYLSIRE
jgi:hypothetical protein